MLSAVLLPCFLHYRTTFLNFCMPLERKELFEVYRIKGWAHIQGISEGNTGCVPYTELATYVHIWSSMRTLCRWLAIAQINSTRHVQIPLTLGVWKSCSYGQSVISLLFLLPKSEILSKEGGGGGEEKEDMPRKKDIPGSR